MSHRQMWVRIRNTLRGRSQRAAPIPAAPARAGWAPAPLMRASCAAPDRSPPALDGALETADTELAAVLLVLPVAVGFMLTGDAVLGVLLSVLAWLPVLSCCAGPVHGWCRAGPHARRPSPAASAAPCRKGGDRDSWARIVDCPIPAREAAPPRSVPASAGIAANRLPSAETA